MDPATIALISGIVSAGASAAGGAISNRKQKKGSKLRAKEIERETKASNLGEALQRSGELEGHRLSSRAKLRKRSAQSMQETADLVRGAFGI